MSRRHAVELVFEREAPHVLDMIRRANKRGDARDERGRFMAIVRQGGRRAYDAVVHPVMQSYGMPQPIRAPEAWNPRRRSDDIGVLRLDLARHLWGRWPVPDFLERTWKVLRAETEMNREEMPNRYYRNNADMSENRRALMMSRRYLPYASWAATVALGKSLYKERAHEVLSRKECHFFLSAPHYMEPHQAIWRARAIGAGASESLANSLASGLFSERAGYAPTSPHSGWMSIMRFMLENPEFIRHETAEILDWAGAMMNERQDWTMKGRTAVSVRVACKEWHRMVQRQKDWAKHNWEGVPIHDWQIESGDPKKGEWRRWEFLQIRDGKNLVQEGAAMRHCVASYAHLIAKGSCGIFSVRLSKNHHMPERARVLTIETNSFFDVVQVRGYANRHATEEEKRAVRAWAGANGLRMTSYAF